MKTTRRANRALEALEHPLAILLMCLCLLPVWVAADIVSTPRHTFEFDHTRGLQFFITSGGELLIASEGFSETSTPVYFYAAGSAVPLQSLQLDRSSWMVAPDTRADRVWVALNDIGIIALYDLSTGQELRRLDLLGQIQQQGAETVRLDSFEVSPDGDTILAAGLYRGPGVEAGGAWILDSDSGSLLRSLTVSEGSRSSPDVWALSPDGNVVLTADYGSDSARVWSATTGNAIGTLLTGDSFVLAATFIRDGATAVLVMAPRVGGSAAVTVWDVETASLLRVMALPDRPDGRVNRGNHVSIAAAPNGRLVAVGTLEMGETGGLDLFDIEAGIHLRHFLGGWNLEGSQGVRGVIFAPDGFSLFARYHEFVKEWDVRDIVSKPRSVRSAAGNEIHWDLGTLQFAPSLHGPWTDLPAASPFPLSPIGGQGFLRVKVEE